MGQLLPRRQSSRQSQGGRGYRNYVIKGLHVPNNLKFELLKEKMDENKSGFILDNYPATQEDLDTLQNYLTKIHCKWIEFSILISRLRK